MRTRRKGRWLPKQPRLGARMCQGTFFFIHDNRMLAEHAFYCYIFFINGGRGWKNTEASFWLLPELWTA